MFHACACGRCYTRDQWNALPLATSDEVPDGVLYLPADNLGPALFLEHRNCTGCGSTITHDLPEAHVAHQRLIAMVQGYWPAGVTL